MAKTYSFDGFQKESVNGLPPYDGAFGFLFKFSDSIGRGVEADEVGQRRSE
jgi:hypothetical protein